MKEDYMISYTHTIFYVRDIQQTIKFYEKAFNIKAKFIHESGTYAELDTNGTSLAFASEELAKMNLPNGYTSLDPKNPPHACEIVFTTENVGKTFSNALEAGASQVSQPQEKPWGQTVAYVRDPEGILIEIASVMS